MRRRVGIALAACACMHAAAHVRAQPQREGPPARGTVVRIDDGQLLVDLSRPEVARDRELEVYRAVTVRHPVTGRELEDRFVIGRIRIVQAGETLSLAEPVDPPSRPIEVGDAVEVGRAPSRSRRPTAPQPEPDAAARPAEAAAIEAWRRTLGRPPAARVAIYKNLLQAHPDSPYAPAVKQEIQALASLGSALAGQPSVAERRAQAHHRLARSVTGEPLRHAREGRNAEVALTFDPDGPVRALVLYARPDDDDTAYERVPMRLERSGYARARLPEALVAPPAFQYFVVAVDDQGRAQPVLGTDRRPVRATVEPAEPDREPEPQRARVRLSTEVASFDGTSGDDWMTLTEGDFLYRVLFGPLYGVRVGYGHFRGMGASLSVLDAGGDPEAAAFTYGFFELELRLHRLLAVMARTTVGLGQLESNAFDESGLRGGFQLRLRIGPERGTNLVLAGESIPEIGQRAFIGLRWEAIEDWPMAAEVHVTDQPVNSGDLGVRGVLEAGRRFAEVATLSARLSFQGRRIDHSGFGAGVAATFDW